MTKLHVYDHLDPMETHLNERGVGVEAVTTKTNRDVLAVVGDRKLRR
jgi:hypothetical protein